MSKKPKIIKKSHIIMVTAVLSLFILLAGFLYYQQEAGAIRQDKQNELRAIASLKVSHINRWRKERIADATVITERPFFIQRVQQWLADQRKGELQRSIIHDLSSIVSPYNYQAVLLSSVEGKLLLSSGYGLNHFGLEASHKIREAVSRQHITSTDFYYCTLENEIHYDVIAPLLNNKKQTIAFLVLRMNPQDYFFPMIQSWPTPSKSAETLIVRQKGDSVVFLNDLRYMQNTALQLQIPLSQKQMPAVQAVLGYGGIMEGIDYRGEKVLADIRSIPNTPWYMIAKVDKKEIYKNLYVKSMYIGGFTLLLILSLASGISLIYNSRQKNIYRNLWQSQQEFKTTLYSIGDAVITTDRQGNIKHMNHIAQQLTGWKESKARGEKLEKVFIIINEITRSRVENPVEKVLREGLIVGLANHSLLISKEGKEIPIADTGAPIKDKKGNTIGVVLVFRDQTEERKAQRALEDSERLYKEAQNVAHIGHWKLDPEVGTPVWSEEIFRIFGLDPEKGEPSFTDHETHVHPDDWPLLNESVTKAGTDGNSFDIEFRIIRPDGEIRWMHAIGTTTKDKKGKVVNIFGTAQDVSLRKQAEEKLRESEKKYRTLFETMAQGVVYQSAEGTIISANPAAEKILGLSPTHMQGRTSLDPGWKAIREDGSELPGEEHPAMQALKTGKSVENFIQGIFNPIKNDYVWIMVNAIPQFRQGDKKPYQVYSTFLDITERKKAQEQVQKDLQEKEVMLQEIHHRVKNNLNVITSLLRLQSKQITSKEEALDAIKKSRDRVYSMALIHNKLYQSEDFSHIDMKDYVATMVSELCNAYGVRKRISIDVQIKDVFLDINKSIPCGLIINELITNSFKHAFPNNKKGTVRIGFQPVDDSVYKLWVEDDGRGLPDDVDIDKSLGFKIINLLAEQINAELEIENKNGTRFTLIIPKDIS